jgi:hypothetical protein
MHQKYLLSKKNFRFTLKLLFGLWFKASPGKWFMIPYLKKIGLVEWLKVKALNSNPSATTFLSNL